MVWSKAISQSRQHAGHAVAHCDPGLHLDRVPLAIVEAHGLDTIKALERPGQACGAILPA